MKFIGAGHGRTEIDMRRDFDRKIVLEDGAEYYGYGFGDTEVQSVCEIVFNTSMVGYQEIISDPSYTNQTVVMTYPLIGNYGIADEDFESRTPTIGGLVVREYNDKPSNFRSRYQKDNAEHTRSRKPPRSHNLGGYSDGGSAENNRRLAGAARRGTEGQLPQKMVFAHIESQIQCCRRRLRNKAQHRAEP